MNLKNLLNPKVLVIFGIILFAAVMRLIPHYPNFTPIAAIALFGGAHLGRKWLAFFVPLFALFISDLIIGFHGFMLPVYISFALVVLLGNLMRNNIRVSSVLGGSLASSTLFFVITNFAVWLGSPFYPQTLAGLMQSYTMGFPFFHTGLIGDLFYNTVFFGGFYLLQLRYPALAKIKA
ncbi:MAG: hypothetical protein EA393_08600 [Bacteroidetes bacterium]|nr:MAG: hypothetical protein EA393_08600 [Bacteroidota bacterium]